jgi:aldose sugar dehydrogenase
MITVLCGFLGFLVILIVLYASYDSGSTHFSYASESETFYVPKVNTIEIEKNQQRGVLNETVSKSVKKSDARVIVLVDNKGSGESEIPIYLEDPTKSCISNFKCTFTNSTGWNDKRSFKVSTFNNKGQLRSSIVGQEVHVESNERYELLSHIKLNEWVKQSNIIIQGFNETSNKWYEILQCPYWTNGPLEWKEFRCSVTIDSNITKIRQVLNAGWSSQKGREAITWFDLFYVTNLKPFVTDPDLKAEVVYDGLEFPTSMAFLGTDDLLVAEKNKGSVQRFVNRGVQSIATNNIKIENVAPEQGVLGIATIKEAETYVFLFYTQPDGMQGDRNLLHRYELVNNSLQNPKLLLDLPAGYQHNGGPIVPGPDKQSVYLAVGDLENKSYKVVPNKALNNRTGFEPDGSGGILRFTKDGEVINGGIIGNKYPLNLYYAYGIRESFGMGFDPITGNLWDTENGHDAGDEINMVEPGFNSGWNKVHGIWPYAEDYIPNSSDIIYNPSDLVTFDGKGKYHSPQFTWNQTVGPTALTFMPTDKLGKQYENDMFVADANNGRIYHFKLNQNRTALLLQGSLTDKVADDDRELKNIIFAGDFGLISDLDVGPDGYLYFLVYNEGKVYRISPLS